jgi:hypothetical protein
MVLTPLLKKKRNKARGVILMTAQIIPINEAAEQQYQQYWRNMHTLAGRWKWMNWILDHIDDCCGKIDPPYQPVELQHEKPESVAFGKDNNLRTLWQRWLDESLKIRHHNTLALRTLLRCYQIAQESKAEAKPDKRHLPEQTLELLAAYLQEVWGVGEQEAQEAGNIDMFVKQKATIIFNGYVNREWVSVFDRSDA